MFHNPIDQDFTRKMRSLQEIKYKPQVAIRGQWLESIPLLDSLIRLQSSLHSPRRLSGNVNFDFLYTIYGIQSRLWIQHIVAKILKSLFSDSLLGIYSSEKDRSFIPGGEESFL
jgi:hypothetical protein